MGFMMVEIYGRHYSRWIVSSPCKNNEPRHSLTKTLQSNSRQVLFLIRVSHSWLLQIIYLRKRVYILKPNSFTEAPTIIYVNKQSLLGVVPVETINFIHLIWGIKQTINSSGNSWVFFQRAEQEDDTCAPRTILFTQPRHTHRYYIYYYCRLDFEARRGKYCRIDALRILNIFLVLCMILYTFPLELVSPRLRRVWVKSRVGAWWNFVKLQGYECGFL